MPTFFLLDLAVELPENTSIKKYVIELIESKQPPYEPIYSLSPVELKTLKAYIQTHLKTEFIWLSKSPIDTSIFLNKKLDGNLPLCVDY